MKIDIEIENILLKDTKQTSFRIRTDEDKNSEEYLGLRNSVEVDGMINPIMVKEVGEKYEIIVGERRIQAAKDLGLKTIPAIIKNDIDQTDIRVLKLAENIHRLDLTDEEKGLGIKAIFEKAGYKNINQVMQFITVLNSRTYNEHKRLGQPNYTNQASFAKEGRTKVDIPKEFQEIVKRIGLPTATQIILLKWIGVPEHIIRMAEEEDLPLKKKILLADKEILKEPKAAEHLIPKMKDTSYYNAKHYRDQEVHNIHKGDVYVKDKATGETIRHDYREEKIPRKPERETVKDWRAILTDLEMKMYPLCDILTGVSDSSCDIDIVKNTHGFRVDFVKKLTPQNLILTHKYLYGLRSAIDDTLTIIEQETESRKMKDNLLKR